MMITTKFRYLRNQNFKKSIKKISMILLPTITKSEKNRIQINKKHITNPAEIENVEKYH